MNPDVIAAGVFGIAGTVVGAVVGLVGGRWVRSWGEVLCEVDSWHAWGTGGQLAGGYIGVEERRLEVTFLNQKDVPVTVWDMQLAFYKGDRPLEAWAYPHLEFVDEQARREPLGRVDLPPRVSVPLAIHATLGRADKREAMEGVDRAEFVASIVGAKDIRRELRGPWHQPPSDTEA